MLLRSAGVTVALAAAIVSLGPAATAVPPVPADHLTLTVANTGNPATDGTFKLFCHPAAGTHPNPQAACDKLDELTRWGSDPFAPVPPNARCTMQYGGPATARLTGSWAGRPVQADFTRINGCEIARWDKLVPVLPATAG